MKLNSWHVALTCLFAGLWLGTLAEKSAIAQDAALPPAAQSAASPKSEPATQDVIKAHEIMLVDKAGNERIDLNADDPTNHSASIILASANQESAVMLADDQDKEPVIGLLKKGKPCMMLTRLDGVPCLLMTDTAKGNQVFLSPNPSAGYLDALSTSGKATHLLSK